MDWCVRKRSARVLGTGRTGASQTCPAHRVGPLSSLGHAQNARTVRSDIWRHLSWFAKVHIVTAVGFLGSVDGLPNVLAHLKLKVISANVVDVIRKWLLIAMKNRDFQLVRYFRTFAPKNNTDNWGGGGTNTSSKSFKNSGSSSSGERKSHRNVS